MPKSLSLSRQNLLHAEQHLSRSDKIMAGLISSHGKCRIVRMKVSPFHTLVSSIISQQLSSKAADTIARRVKEIVSDPFTPSDFIALRRSHLRKAGLSNAKAKYILELSRHVANGRVNFDHFKLLEDENIIASLTELPGIGRWTAEMFLIFAMKRPNVMSMNDAGLQRAVSLLYGKRTSLQRLKKIWHPYCSVASWYLWRHLDA